MTSTLIPFRQAERHSGICVKNDRLSAGNKKIAAIFRQRSPASRPCGTPRSPWPRVPARDIAHRTLALLSSADIAAYRDERLKTVSTASVIRELNTIAHAIDIGRKEWGVHLVQNPVRMIRRPVPPRGRIVASTVTTSNGCSTPLMLAATLHASLDRARDRDSRHLVR